MTEADMDTGDGAAPTQETQVPKWRLDEVLARLRAREEELNIKDQLLTQVAPRNQGQANGMTPESLGMEPSTFEAVQRLANHIADQKLRNEAQPMKHQMAAVMNKVEETEFLLKYGKEKAKYLDRIKSQRQTHYQTTGGYQSVEDAYKLVMFDEMTRATAPKAPAPSAEANPGQAPVVPSGPDATQTRQTGGAPVQAGKPFDQMTHEEQEAFLDSQLSGGLI